MLRILGMGFLSAMLALLGFTIYEWLRKKWLVSKQFRVLAEKFKFSEEESSFIWKTSKGKILQLVSYDKKGREKYVNGFEIPKISDTMLKEIQTGIPNGYLTFICDFNKKNKRLAIIKGVDKFTILKTMQTNGESFKLSNGKLINDLKLLDKNYQFSINGAGFDWVELTFDTFPEENDTQGLNSLVSKLIELMPPQDNSADYRARFKEELVTTRKAFLWWPKLESEDQEDQEDQEESDE